MITAEQLDWSGSRLPPFIHQKEDALTLINNPYVFITSEMRTGKTKIVIDAAHFLFKLGLINRVVVVCPAPIRDVWFDQEFGEIQKHCWKEVDNHVTEYHSVMRKWTLGPSPLPFNHANWHGIKWIVTNFDFIRNENRLLKLLPYVDSKTLLVLDESSAVKSHSSKQTEACERLRYIHRRQVKKGKVHYIKTDQVRAGRIVLMNGTPFDTPIDLYSQSNMLHPSILDCKYVTHFRARYAIMGGHTVVVRGQARAVEVQKWVNLEDLRSRLAPFTIRRLQSECLDLPPKLDPVTLTVQLTERTWSYYKKMRDDLIISFENGEVTSAPHAITKVMRLAQIASGFVGGVESIIDDDDDFDSAEALPPWIDYSEPMTKVRRGPVEPVKEIGREKLDMLLWFYKERFRAEPKFKILVWCRFKPEMQRAAREVAALYPQVIVATISGGQKKADRRQSLALLHPDTTPDEPVFAIGTYGTGSKGLNCTAAHTSLNCSYDYSLEKFLQSGDRVYGPGQTHPVAYYDMVAVGPQGQKTIDHVIVKARREKQDISEWTTAAWVQHLRVA